MMTANNKRRRSVRMTVTAAIAAAVMTVCASAFPFEETESAAEREAICFQTVLSEAENYGTPFFFQDFRSFLGHPPVSGQSVGKVPEAYGSGSYIVYDCNVGAAFDVEEPEELENLAVFSVSGNMMYPQMRITNMNITRPGLYTLVCDYYVPDDSSLAGLNIYAGRQTAVQTFVRGRLTHNVMSYILNEGDTLNTLGFEGINPAQGDGTFWLSDIVLYYKELPTASVTVYADGAGECEAFSDTVAYGDGFTLPTAAAFQTYIPDGFRLVGFTVNGTSVTLGSVYAPTDADFDSGALTVLPVYASAVVTGYGTQLFYGDFEETAVDRLIFNNGVNGTHTSVYANTWISLLNTAACPMDAYTFCVSRGANLMSSYIANVNGTKAVAVDQTGVLPNFGVYGGAGNTQQSLHLTENGYYTVSCEFYVPALFADSVKTLYPRVYFEDGSFVNGRLLTESVEADVWMNARVTLEQKTGSSPIRNILFIAETNTPNDGVTFYTDNIAMYYTDTLAPKTLPVFSIRTEMPNGLRFMSFVGTLGRNQADEYGFLITVDDGTEHDYDTEFILGNGVREDGRMIVNEYGMRVISTSNYVKDRKDLVYATDDAILPQNAKYGSDGVYFTAAVTGVPENGYHDTIYARPYLKIADRYVYGAVVGTSLYETAYRYRNSENYVENDFIEGILAIENSTLRQAERNG